VDPAVVRLACQLRPLGDLAVTPLVPPETAGSYVMGHAPRLAGEERFVAALFVDLRDSTQLAESHLPYDSVFLVGRFVAAVARAVVEAGGVPNQFLGDGVLALFGLEDGPQAACRAALDALARIEAALDALNAAGAEPQLRAGIGLHCGRAIVGEIGFGAHVTTTALGDPVNAAARLQETTRAVGCDVVVSEAVFLGAELRPCGERRVLDLRGRGTALPVRLLREGMAEIGAAQRMRPQAV
jgi:adenylate cyclase